MPEASLLIQQLLLVSLVPIVVRIYDAGILLPWGGIMYSISLLFQGGKIMFSIIIRSFLLVFLAIYSVTALAVLEKPKVAIKEPVVSSKLSKFTQQSLRLNLIVGELEAALRNTRKFEVYSRQKAEIAAIMDEQNLASSDFAKGNAAKDGELNNVSLILIPEVREFKFYREARAVPNIEGKYSRKDSGRLVVQIKVLDTATGEIKGVFSLKDSFATAKQIVNKKGGRPETVYFSKMAKSIAGQFANKLIDRLFPMIVIKAGGEQVWINRGQDGGLKKGQALNVYRAGEELIDPYTKEVLGSAEVYLGQIKVIRINPKFTIAKIKKSSEPFLAGDVVRAE